MYNQNFLKKKGLLTLSDSRSIKAVRNIITANATKLLSFVLTFVSRTVFIRVFGAEMLGLNGLFANVLSILSLADLGFSTAMTYSYYKPIAENDKKKIAALNHFYKKVYLLEKQIKIKYYLFNKLDRY